jgi:hypothetical protein
MHDSSRRSVLRAPSTGFAVSGAPPEVFLPCTILPRAVGCRPPSVGLASSEPRTCRRFRRIVCSHGVSYESPLRRPTMLRPLPDTRRCRSARWYHPVRLVPPTRFLTVPAACSAASPAGLFRPASGHGVHDLAGVPSHPPPKWRGQADLSDRARTLRSLSSPAAAPCHHGRFHPDVAPGDARHRPSADLAYTPACTGKLEPTEMGLHVPAAPWSATAADESTAIQVCDRDPRSEDRTCALARSLCSRLHPLRERGGSQCDRDRAVAFVAFLR